MKPKKILFHTRFRDMALEALLSLLELKRVGLKEVVLTFVIPRDEVAFVPYGGYLKDHENEIREQVALRFKPWQEALAARDVAATVRIEVGMDNAVLLAVAEQENVDLIVTGRKKRTLMERVYVGTHILDLARRSPVPILMHKVMAEYEDEGRVQTRINDRPFAKPMLATDWSKPSFNALNAVIALKGLTDRAVVAHVIGVKISKGLDSDQLDVLRQESKARLAGYGRQLEQAGIRAETVLSEGRTAAQIIHLSRQHQASMIVLGRTGKDWLREYFLGGVSHRVAENSELPVLLVP